MEKPTLTTLDEATAMRMAALFDSLSDATRLRILAALMDGEVNVGDLAKLIDLSKSAVSHQLRGLRDKHVIRTRKKGRHVYVAIDDEHITELFMRGLDHVRHE